MRHVSLELREKKEKNLSSSYLPHRFILSPSPSITVSFSLALSLSSARPSEPDRARPATTTTLSLFRHSLSSPLLGAHRELAARAPRADPARALVLVRATSRRRCLLSASIAAHATSQEEPSRRAADRERAPGSEWLNVG